MAIFVSDFSGNIRPKIIVVPAIVVNDAMVLYEKII